MAQTTMFLFANAQCGDFVGPYNATGDWKPHTKRLVMHHALRNRPQFVVI